MPRKTSSSRQKVKSGCLTCKARKVKCDETKPVCARCRSTGRTCDGYGIWGGGGNGYAERYSCTNLKRHTREIRPYTAASVFQASPFQFLTSGFTEPISLEESKHLQWFDHEVTHTGFPGTAFWVSLIMPAIWTEPAILHAMVALSAAYRSKPNERASSEVERFTLLQYTKSIKSLQPLLKYKDRSSLTVVLVTCLLYTILEYLRQRYDVAGVHLQSGLQLLRDQHAPIAESHSGFLLVEPSPRPVDQQIFQGFAALHLQAKLFGNYVPDVALVLQPTGLEMPTPLFSSLEEARDSLNKMLHGTLLLSQIVQTHVDAGEDIPASSRQAQDHAMALLSTWSATYELTVQHLQSSLESEELAYLLLLNYHSMATIICRSIGSPNELVYDAYTEAFVLILERSVRLLDCYRLGQNGGLTGSVVDLGWIPPLYYTALKCRVRHLRMHAIQLLRSVPHKQGLWDASLTASIAEKVMEIEEGGFHTRGHQRDYNLLGELPQSMDKESPMLLGPRRVFVVKVGNLGPNRCDLDCKERQDDGSVYMYHSHFDGERWHDDPCTDASDDRR